MSTEPWVIFLLINLILFVLGTFMDMASTILICTPIFLPIAAQYGMDPVQFGIVHAGQLRARAQYAAGRHHAVRRLRDRRHLGRAGDAHDLPFYGALTAALLAVTYVPAFSLWLPRLAGYLQ